MWTRVLTWMSEYSALIIVNWRIIQPGWCWCGFPHCRLMQILLLNPDDTVSCHGRLRRYSRVFNHCGRLGFWCELIIAVHFHLEQSEADETQYGWRGARKGVVLLFLAPTSITSLVIKWKTKYLEICLKIKTGKLSVPCMKGLPLLCPCVNTHNCGDVRGLKWLKNNYWFKLDHQTASCWFVSCVCARTCGSAYVCMLWLAGALRERTRQVSDLSWVHKSDCKGVSWLKKSSVCDTV